jgi:Ti-type conjugative transfer relaxase TraA
MLSIGKLAAGPTAGRYYVEQVAQGREDYYAGEGEAPGGWVGTGAASLALRGEVTEGGITQLLDGRDPGSGAQLRRPLASGAVAGFDLTFRAPKSVSVLFGIGDPELSDTMRAAHESAVGEALGYLEREACRARRGRGGALVVEGRGFVGAAFGHRSSRAGDPLLHTHVVVANATQGPDGRWTALDGRALYRHAKTAGYLYQADLRRRLSEELGLQWHPVDNGVADIVGVPRDVIEHFSQRRAEILEHMAARGEHSARAAQVATLETRRAKEHDVPVHRLRADWRARAAEHGLDRHGLERVLSPGRERQTPAPTLDESRRVADQLLSPRGLTREASTFTRRDVVRAFAEAARDGATIAEIETAADALLARHAAVELKPVGAERTYTTADLLELERSLLRMARSRRDQAAGLVDETSLSDALAARPTLSDEQRELVDSLTRSGDGIEVVRAAAGTGKTFALDAAREAWQAAEVPVLGCALSARAACELRDQAGLDTTTIARLKRGLERGYRLTQGSVLIVDEAGMVGTRDLATLADAADLSDAKLVLVGDDRQLPEIEAGGAFRALADELDATELREVRRQREAWDRDALDELRHGQPEVFAREYHQHGRLIAARDAERAREALVDDWFESHQRGERALMIAHRRRDVAELNERGRARLRDAGRLGPDELEVKDRGFAVGDRVVTTRNDRSLDVVNGQAGRLTAIEDGRLTIELDDRTVDIPDSYARDGDLDHGYASTAHRAQGATVDRSFVLGSDELYREWGYTALSRHRDEARFYVSATPDFLNRAPDALTADDDLADHVARTLADSRAEHLALDGFARDWQAERLTEELDRAQERLAEIETRVEALHEERQETRWYRRGRRAELEKLADGWARGIEHWQTEVDRLGEALAERPALEEPELLRGHDPLAELEPPPMPEPVRDIGPAPGPDLDLDFDMGMDL